MHTDFALVGQGGVLDAVYDGGLEELTLLDEFADALVVHIFPARETLEVAGLAGGLAAGVSGRLFRHIGDGLYGGRLVACHVIAPYGSVGSYGAEVNGRRLAGWAPEGGAGVEALLAGLDGCAANAAGLAAAMVDPEVLFGVGAAGGAADAGVGDDLVARGVGDVGRHQLAGVGDEGGEFGDGERLDGAEGMDAAGEADLGLEDVADSGEEVLGEEGDADFEVGAGS